MISKKAGVTAVLTLYSIVLVAQQGTGIGELNTKANQQYNEQKSISSSVAPQAALLPLTLPGYQDLMSLNQSGDGIVNIPVFAVKGRKLVLPINLTYVTNGIKIEQASSDVGLGWNISFGSIVRDYGAFEPDYTYTGSEFEMKGYMNLGTDDRQLNVAGYSYPVDPLEQNAKIYYDGVNANSGIGSDDYIVNIPGLKSNSFWNSNPSKNPNYSPNFVFSEKTAWKLFYSLQNFQFPQEVSRINEFDYLEYSGNPQTKLLNDHNVAAAIGFYPYVKESHFTKYIQGPNGGTSGPNLPTAQDYIKYQDFSQFTIIASDGTTYIFSKPLRAQKYLVEEQPFWSSMIANPWFPNGMSTIPAFSPKKCGNELWKTEYITEWLLTEVRSSDYEDRNQNGFDPSDPGDWIKINYTESAKEWLNFTQTDKESSLWRERAYVTSIQTPIQTITLNSQQKLDIDFDHFNTVFNRVNNVYVYNGKSTYAPSNLPIWLPTSTISASHPLELKSYSGIEVQSSEGPVQNIEFNYAAPGSAEQLAKSNYYIINSVTNSGSSQSINYIGYNPDNVGSNFSESTYYHSTARGKATLVGLSIRGSNAASANVIKYGFEYANNPSFNKVSLHKIKSFIAFPTIRESHRQSDIRWNVPKVFQPPVIDPNAKPFGQSYLPWKSLIYFTRLSGTTLTTDNFSSYLNTSGVATNYGNPIFSDELGYFFDDNLSNKGKDAWSLSSLIIPYGGRIDIVYGTDKTDITADRNNWLMGGIADYATPAIGHYNNIAFMRSAQQKEANTLWPNTVNPPERMKETYNQYYYFMNENSGGLRIDKLTYIPYYIPAQGSGTPPSSPPPSTPTNPIHYYGGTPIEKSFTYGNGHFVMPPSDHWQNYMKGLSAFINEETQRHFLLEAYSSQFFNLDTSPPPYSFSDFTNLMSRLFMNERIDKSIKDQGRHYYEYIEESTSGGGKTRWYYGSLIPVVGQTNPRLSYLFTKNGCLKKTFGSEGSTRAMVGLLATDIDHSKDIGNYKTEYFDKNGNIIKETSVDYSFTEDLSSSISLDKEMLPANRFVVWSLFSNGLGLNPDTNPNSMFSFYNSLSANERFAFGYRDAFNPLAQQINIAGEAAHPLFKIYYKSGAYGTDPMPWWVYHFDNVKDPWQGTSYTNSQISTICTGLMGAIKAHGGNVLSIQHFDFFTDVDSYIDALAYKAHQCYRLQPVVFKTIMKY